METRFEVKVFRVNKICDKCDCGNLIFTRTFYSVGKAKTFEHKCDRCESIQFFEKEYPFFDYEELLEKKYNENINK